MGIWGGGQKEVYSCEYVEQVFTLVLLHINYCAISHMNNCKPTFAHGLYINVCFSEPYSSLPQGIVG